MSTPRSREPAKKDYPRLAEFAISYDATVNEEARRALAEIDKLRVLANQDYPTGFVKHNGAGEIIFRQTPHESYWPGLLEDHWTPVWIL